MDKYTDINAKTIDRWVEEGWRWGIPLSVEECEKARQGEWSVVLTPNIPVPKDWFVDFKGAKILGLASGGGQQLPIFSILGADCTVMDISERQLESERFVAQREGYKINVVKADMTQRFPFEDGSFDLIFHPVSNSYVEDVYHVWRECHRVLKPGGILLSGLDNGINYLFDDFTEPLIVKNALPYNPLKNPELMERDIKNDDGVQFSHTFDEQIGGQLKAGFIITAAFEDYNSISDEDATIRFKIPSFWATRSVKQIL